LHGASQKINQNKCCCTARAARGLRTDPAR
jgi:hypothetical protein